MLLQTKIFGKVKQGKFIPDDIGLWRKIVNKYNDKTGIYCCFGKEKKGRSLNQNAYYWGIIIKMLSDESGYFPEEIHEILKFEFLRTDYIDKNGKTRMGTRSTTTLSTIEFNDYIEKCIVFASINYCLIIPLPKEIL